MHTLNTGKYMNKTDTVYHQNKFAISSLERLLPSNTTSGLGNMDDNINITVVVTLAGWQAGNVMQEIQCHNKRRNINILQRHTILEKNFVRLKRQRFWIWIRKA